MAPNPFSFDVPAEGVTFCGRRWQVKEIADDLSRWNGASHAVIAGLHMGKSSLLRAIATEMRGRLAAKSEKDLCVLPVPVTLRAIAGVKSEEELLGYFRLRMVQALTGLSALSAFITNPATIDHLQCGVPRELAPATLQEFEASLSRVVTTLEPLLGPTRVAMLVENIEIVAEDPWVDPFFDHLNALVHDGDQRDCVRLVLTGAERLLAIKQKGSPLLRSLRLHFLEPLSENDARTLLEFAPELPPEVGNEVINQASGHPYILQHLLYYLCQSGAQNATPETLAFEVQRFVNDRSTDLDGWWSSIGPEGQRLYAYLNRAGDWVARSEITRALGPEIGSCVTRLVYHGLATHDGSHKRFCTCCGTFSDWYRTKWGTHTLGDASRKTSNGLDDVLETTKTMQQSSESVILKNARENAFIGYRQKGDGFSLVPDSEGLHPIVNTDKSDRQADIVFVHGLGGTSHSTWRHGKQGTAHHFFWPEELGKDQPQCGIWSVGYPAGFTGLGKQGMIIEKRAGNLSDKLANGGLGDRPILFITHSMGGLVVKHLIVDSQTLPGEDRKRIVSHIRGIVFCGTPHRGAAFADAARVFGILGGGSQAHVAEMRANAERLDLLHDKFIEWHHRNPNPVSIVSYAESKKLSLTRWIFFPTDYGVVVPRASANPGIQGCDIHDSDDDHLTLVKPTRRTGDVYSGVLRFIIKVLTPTSARAATATDPIPTVAVSPARRQSDGASTKTVTTIEFIMDHPVSDFDAEAFKAALRIDTGVDVARVCTASFRSDSMKVSLSGPPDVLVEVVRCFNDSEVAFNGFANAIGLAKLVCDVKGDHYELAVSKPATHRESTEATMPKNINISEVKGRVHAAIITVRHDEYDAVESRLEGSISVDGGNNSYEFATLQPDNGGRISVALTRCVGQGNLSAQAVANNIIQDLDPAWLLLVGIAGGVPDNEFSLGDVILASSLHDFSFGAATSGGGRTYQTSGGPMHPDVVKFLQTKIGGKNRHRLLELAGFGGGDGFLRHPPVFTSKKNLTTRLYGEPNFQKKVCETVMRRFPKGARDGGPRVWSGPCANGNLLVKDPSLLEEWQRSARQVVDMETELAGVFEAARSAGRQNYPVLAVRGLSDVVGLKRDPNWTQYACNTAAAFVHAILQSGFIDFSRNLPNPR